jgi:hypothetical protein
VGGAYSQTAVTPTDTAGDYDWIEQGNGLFTIEIPASGGASINNDTEGYGWFTGVATGILPWKGPVCQFSPANVVNSLVVGSDLLDVNTGQIEGADPSDTIRDAVVDDATRIDASALNTASGTTIPAILDDTDLIDDGTSGLAKIATDVAAILVDTSTTLQGELDGIQADTEDIQSRLPAALVGGRIDATVDGTGLEATAAAVIADAVWDEAATGHTDAGKAGEQLWTDVDAILVDTGTTLDGLITTVDTVVDAIKAKTDSLTFTVASQVDANVQAINDVALTGDGDVTPWGPV